MRSTPYLKSKLATNNISKSTSGARREKFEIYSCKFLSKNLIKNRICGFAFLTLRVHVLLDQNIHAHVCIEIGKNIIYII